MARRKGSSKSRRKSSSGKVTGGVPQKTEKGLFSTSSPDF